MEIVKLSFQKIITTFFISGTVLGVLLGNIGAGICFAGAAGITYALVIAKAITETDFL
jgi:hypothetical protein